MAFINIHLKAAVTVFASLIFLLVVSVISATIVSARAQAARVYVATSAGMALDSFFSKYDVTLRDKYGVLLRECTSEASSIDEISEYMDYNLDAEGNLLSGSFTDLYGIDIVSTEMVQLLHPTDQYGLLWEKMIVDYEKLFKTADIIGDYTGIDEEVDNAEATGSICDSLSSCAEEAVAINNKVMELIRIIDGVNCPEMGIDLSDINTETYFVKVIDPDYKTGVSAIDEELEYSYISVEELVNNININLNTFIDFGYIEELNFAIADNEELYELLTSLDQLISEGIALISDIDQSRASLSQSIASVEESISGMKNVLTSTLTSSLTDEIDQLKTYTETDYSEYCDPEQILVTLKQDQIVVESMLSCYEELNSDYMDTDAERYKNKLDKLAQYSKQYVTDNMEFDYSHLLADEGSGDTSDSIKESLDSAVLSLALPDGESVSSASIDISDLASSLGCSGNPSDIVSYDDGYTGIFKMALYNEYLFDKMSSFTDKKQNGYLNYEIEYILYGYDSDEENLEELVLSMSTVRSGFNMAYLLSDSAKKQEAYAAAAAMIGFTGIAPLITILQYTLLYLWAYAEAIVDVKCLLSGYKVPIIKTSAQWTLSIQNLLSCNLSVSNKSEQKGLSYEQYLRLFMYWYYDCEFFYRTMDIVELNMMLQEDDQDFRLSNYLYGATICVNYGVPEVDLEYMDYEAFTY